MFSSAPLADIKATLLSALIPHFLTNVLTLCLNIKKDPDMGEPPKERSLCRIWSSVRPVPKTWRTSYRNGHGDEM